MSRLGKMPDWQKKLVHGAMITCSLTGCIYLLGQEFDVNKSLLGSYSVLAWHGVSAILATLALGTILPFHLKAGLKAKRNFISGISQLCSLTVLLVSGALLYYGPEEVRDAAIYTHWIVGLLFVLCFVLHGVFKQNHLRTT